MRGIWIATPIVAAVALGSQIGSVSSIVNPPKRATGLEAQETHAAASLLGQFRTSFSSMLYLRTDLYLHGGVEMRPLSKQEMESGKKGVGHAADEETKIANDDVIVTVIPSAKDDFRGIFGDVERSVASYKDMVGHHHQSPTQTIPLFRLMTLIDPQFIEGWTTGGYAIVFEPKPGSVEKALSYSREGLANNPESIDILGQIAECYLKEVPQIGYKGRNYKEALPYLQKSRHVGIDHFKTLTTTEKESMQENYRREAVCYRELAMYPEMLEVSVQGLQVFGQDGSLRQHAQEAMAKLKSSTSPTK